MEPTSRSAYAFCQPATESQHAEDHEPFFNSIDPLQTNAGPMPLRRRHGPSGK